MKNTERQPYRDVLADFESSCAGPNVPLGHKDDSWSSSHFNRMIVSIADVACQKIVWSVWPSPPTWAVAI
jgi:hypothetical protein